MCLFLFIFEVVTLFLSFTQGDVVTVSSESDDENETGAVPALEVRICLCPPTWQGRFHFFVEIQLCNSSLTCFVSEEGDCSGVRDHVRTPTSRPALGRPQSEGASPTLAGRITLTARFYAFFLFCDAYVFVAF